MKESNNSTEISIQYLLNSILQKIIPAFVNNPGISKVVIGNIRKFQPLQNLVLKVLEDRQLLLEILKTKLPECFKEVFGVEVYVTVNKGLSSEISRSYISIHIPKSSHTMILKKIEANSDGIDTYSIDSTFFRSIKNTQLYKSLLFDSPASHLQVKISFDDMHNLFEWVLTKESGKIQCALVLEFAHSEDNKKSPWTWLRQKFITKIINLPSYKKTEIINNLKCLFLENYLGQKYIINKVFDNLDIKLDSFFDNVLPSKEYFSKQDVLDTKNSEDTTIPPDPPELDENNELLYISRYFARLTLSI